MHNASFTGCHKGRGFCGFFFSAKAMTLMAVRVQAIVSD
jgi:hypothetical protein